MPGPESLFALAYVPVLVTLARRDAALIPISQVSALHKSSWVDYPLIVPSA